MTRGVANKQRKQDPQSRIENKTPFEFVSIWLWCSRCYIIPYCYNRHGTWFSLMLHCCKLCWPKCTIYVAKKFECQCRCPML